MTMATTKIATIEMIIISAIDNPFVMRAQR
jgi:hypothetical protein